MQSLVRNSARIRGIPRVPYRFASSNITASSSMSLRERINNFYERVPNNKDKELPSIFEDILNSDPRISRSKFSARVLKTINPSSKNEALLTLALRNVKPEDINEDTMTNLTYLLKKICTHRRISREVQTRFAELYKDLCSEDLIKELKKDITEHESSLNKHILMIMLLKTKKLKDAYDLAYTSLTTDEMNIRADTVELAVQHLCVEKEIQKAATLIELARIQPLELYPRTYSLFLSKAVQMNEYKICDKFQVRLMERMYIDNGTLVRLVECLIHAGAFDHIEGLKKRASQKSSFPVNFMKRIDVALVEARAKAVGFQNGWKKMESLYQDGDQLTVADYPYMKASMETEDISELNAALHELMNHRNDEMRRFALNLAIAKLCDEGRLQESFILMTSRALRDNIRENVILQLAHGAVVLDQLNSLRDVCELVEETGVRFLERKTINFLTSSLAESDHFMLVFRMLERCDIEDYKLNPEVYALLEAKCQEHNTEINSSYKPK